MTSARTHLEIDPGLVGSPIALEEGRATVELALGREMAVDDRGLVHGGFVFGLADYAAMLAVNDPHVVLGAARVTFVKPVRVGERLRAEAEVRDAKGKKREVAVTVFREHQEIFEGSFTCFVLEAHVLDLPRGEG